MASLWSPIRVGTLELPNRLVMAAMGTAFAEPDGRITDRLIRFLERRAQGGVGLVVTEAIAVDPGGVPFPGVPRADGDRYLDGLRALAAAVRGAGARVAAQLSHAGRQMSTRWAVTQPVAPSAIACPATRTLPRALEDAEVETLVERFVQAAARAHAAGFDAVELSAGHGYLIHQFLSPRANRRDDRWGGDPERRARFAVEIVRRIRGRLGASLAILVKLSAEEGLAGGLGLADTVAIAHRLAGAGADAIVASAGTYASFDWLVQPALRPEGCLRGHAAALRRAVSVPVAAVGRITDPALAAAIVESGDADLVALGRALLADPDLPQKARAGQTLAVRPCIACNQCLRRLFAPEPINCSVNPEAGREAEPPAPPAPAPGHVVVIGGGAAGMTAAALARERGHRVTLLEAESELGGRLRAAARVPYRREMGRLAVHLAGRLSALGVDVRLGATATPAAVGRLRPDALIRATGARPTIPAVPGINRPHVETAEQCLLGLAPGRGAVVVVGDTAAACDAAAALQAAGYAPTLLAPGTPRQLALEAESVTRRALLAGLEDRRIPVLYDARLEAVEARTVRFRAGSGESRELPADRVVLALGPEADEAGAAPYAAVGCPVWSAGDCLTPGGVLGAVHGTAEVVRRMDLQGAPARESREIP
jgi:2,4-dienoyl-CoA reductase-like NADH-dependent reductase (Old Yellow Enzyme family)